MSLDFFPDLITVHLRFKTSFRINICYRFLPACHIYRVRLRNYVKFRVMGLLM